MWNLMFTGDLVTGFNRPDVIDNLANLVHKSPEWISRNWFSGSPVKIETVSTEQDATRWRRDFADAGALLLVVPVDEEHAGISRYAGQHPANIRTEEPTMASVTARIPAIRRRNHAFMILGGFALLFVLIFAIIKAAFG